MTEKTVNISITTEINNKGVKREILADAANLDGEMIKVNVHLPGSVTVVYPSLASKKLMLKERMRLKIRELGIFAPFTRKMQAGWHAKDACLKGWHAKNVGQ